MNNIEEKLLLIHQRIKRACIKGNREPNDVRLLLATKTVPAEKIALALQCGEILIGENKVQELKEKDEILSKYNPEGHFIGHLQTKLRTF